MSKIEECMICLDAIQEEEQGLFTATSSCSEDHDICRDCLIAYLYKELETHRPEYTTIPCPRSGCPNQYRSADIVPRVFETAEAQHLEGFCPSVDCQTSFELFSEDAKAGETVDEYAECPECKQGICIVCGLVWHSDRTCHRTNLWRWPLSRALAKEKQRQRDRSVEVRLLACEQKWTRCPGCRNMISKSNGCNTIVCRCGTEFCYRCGSRSSGHVCSIHCERLSDKALAAVRQPMYIYPKPKCADMKK